MEPMGRPKTKPDSRQPRWHVSVALQDALKAAAEREGRSCREVADEAIAEWIKKRGYAQERGVDK